ncbi:MULTISPECIES: tetratricopeptide repeat protein [unclassified Bradyrhizobium]|uniref:tetratricopeptide repeat protein n=1 Tax=unclassified Bradyrhizobium TaxID=2631580 RepID=UPI002916EA78|nr:MULTISPECIES: tetratricopeptide repeat protein [unclassified Bradyrhizobium]
MFKNMTSLSEMTVLNSWPFRNGATVPAHRPAAAVSLFAATFFSLSFLGSALAGPKHEQVAIAQIGRFTGETNDHARTAIQTLAAAAKQAFHKTVEPPIPKLIFVDFIDVRRDYFSILRDYAQSNFDAAIDALAAEATTPERAGVVENALRKFVAVRQTSPIDAIFAEMIQRKSSDARATAAALRYSVALVDLPEALAKLILPRGKLPFAPSGEKALPAYKRAAELDSGDAWTWIIVAILEDDKVVSKTAVANAERAATAAGDWRALVFSRQLFGLNEEVDGRFTEASRAYEEALALARARSATEPSDIGSRRELARDLVWICDRKSKRAPADARAACEEALSIREGIATSQPDDMRGQEDIIASYIHLGSILETQGSREAASQYLKKAMRRYQEIASRSGFAASFNPLEARLLPAFLFGVLVPAGTLTLLLGLVTLALYRHRINYLMRATVGESGLQKPQSGTPSFLLSEGSPNVAIRSVNATEAFRTVPYRSEPISHATVALRNAAWGYAIAGCAFGVVATFLFFFFHDLDFNLNRAITVFLAWAWPIVLTLNLLWGPDRRQLGLLLLAYSGLLLVVCIRVALGDTPPLRMHDVMIPAVFQPLVFWGLEMLPTLFLLLFLNRSMRAVGPLVLVLMLSLTCGYYVGLAVSSIHTVMLKMVALTSMLGVTSGAVAYVLPGLMGAALFVPVGWIVIRIIRHRYEAKRFSDQAIVFCSIWLFQTLILWEQLFMESGHWAWAAFAAFGLYELILWLSLPRLTVGALRQPPARLLLLRTFGFRRRAEKFFDRLNSHWSYAGPIQFIAAPDLAGHSINPVKFLDFVSGRLHLRFAKDPSDLDHRLAAFDHSPDRDGRYRVNELFCGDEAWREAVRRLMGTNDLVLMDLRGFTEKNRGCMIELQALIDLFPAGNTVLLVDETSDVRLLRPLLGNCWRDMAEGSPNRNGAGVLTLLDVGHREARAVDVLLSIADDILAKRTLPLSQLHQEIITAHIGPA